MAGTGAIRLFYRTGNKNCDILIGYPVIIDDETISLLKYGQIEGRIGELSKNFCVADAIRFHERLLIFPLKLIVSGSGNIVCR
jgi:hypothetical protein